MYSLAAPFLAGLTVPCVAWPEECQAPEPSAERGTPAGRSAAGLQEGVGCRSRFEMIFGAGSSQKCKGPRKGGSKKGALGLPAVGMCVVLCRSLWRMRPFK